MSYRIEYQWVALAITPEQSPGLGEPRYVVAIEGGDNNLYTSVHGRSARRARSWDIGMIGTQTQVLRQATLFASACEIGDLQPGGRCIKPEQYLRRIRRAIDEVFDPSLTLGHLGLGARLACQHPLVLAPHVEGFTYYSDSLNGKPFVKLIPPGPDHWAKYFEMLDPYLDDLSLAPYRVGEVWGLPSS